MLTQLEISFPGSLKLACRCQRKRSIRHQRILAHRNHPAIHPDDLRPAHGLGRKYCPSQRPIAFPFGGLALAFIIRELDYFFDRFIVDNLWQALVAIAGALVITYTYRQRKRLKIAWARIWPSPGIALLFAGASSCSAFVLLVGHEPLWMSILGDSYQRIVKLAVEEFIEMSAYFLWLIGSIEYAYQARAIAYRAPQPAAQRLREKRRHDAEGEY